MKKRFVLVHDLARQRAIEHVRSAPHGYVVEVKEQGKSREQEEKYHAMIGDIADQWRYLGMKWRPEHMKRILVDAFKIDTKDDDELAECWRQMGDVQLAPGMRGGVVILGDQTRSFPKKLAIAFIEWLYALGAEHGVEWSEPRERAA